MNKYGNDVAKGLFLTREMIEDICDLTIYSLNQKARKGLCFYVSENFTEIIQKNAENGNLSYNYEDNPNILIVENNELQMTEVYSRNPLKVTYADAENRGLFENVLLTCLHLANLDLTQVKSMKYWFYGAKIDTIDFSRVNTPSLLNMHGMFSSCEINRIIWGNISTYYVTDMSEMFSDCIIPELLLSSIGTTRVEDMSEMFRGCWAVKIDCSNFDTRRVRNMDSMFYETRVKSLDLSGFDTTKVTNMDLMFSNCDVEFLNIKNFNMINVKSYEYMFSGCNAKLIAKDKVIISIYEKETKKEVKAFDYRDLPDILNAKLENLDIDMFIIETIMGSTRCELIKHLWGLSAHELCYSLGLKKEELEKVLNEMEKIANLIEICHMRLLGHVNRCRDYLKRIEDKSDSLESLSTEKNKIEYEIEKVDFSLAALKKKSEIVTVHLIIKKVAKFYNLSVEQLLSDERTTKIIHARLVAMYLCRELTGCDENDMRVPYRLRKHISFGYTKIRKDIKSDKKLHGEIVKIMKTINL